MSTAIERISIDAPYGSDVVADARPAIGWVTRSEADGWRQARAELELRLGDGVQTHVVEGRDSVRVPWPFAPLAPREEAELRVRVTGTDGAASDWSAPRRIVAGFLADGEWTARKMPTRSVEELVGERTSPAVKSALKSLLEAPFTGNGGRGRGRRKANAKGGNS